MAVIHRGITLLRSSLNYSPTQGHHALFANNATQYPYKPGFSAHSCKISTTFQAPATATWFLPACLAL
jgi:hypothetical protein